MTQETYRFEDDLKSDRLNDPVALFMGCTLSETISVVLVSLGIALGLAVLPIWLIWDRFTIGLAIALILLAPIFLTLLMKLSRLKRGKPAGYHLQYLKMQGHRLGLFHSPYVVRSGKWSTERRQ